MTDRKDAEDELGRGARVLSAGLLAGVSVTNVRLYKALAFGRVRMFAPGESGRINTSGSMRPAMEAGFASAMDVSGTPAGLSRS